MKTSLLRVARVVMAAVIVYALVDQVVYSNAHSPRSDNTVNFFSFFTVDSNICAVVSLLVTAAMPAVAIRGGFSIFRGAATLYMTVTLLVYQLLLRPASADVGLTKEYVDWVLHAIGPAFVLLDWWFVRAVRPTWRQLSYWLVFPFVYVAYTLIRGPHTELPHFYPYPFLNPHHGGYLVVAAWCVAISIAFVLVATLLRWRAKPAAA